MLPTNRSPSDAVYRPAQRGIAVAVYEEMVHDRQFLLRWCGDAPRCQHMSG